MELVYFLSGIIGTAPQIIVWIVALVLSIILLKRSGGRLTRFLVAGSSLLLVSSVSIGLTNPLINYLDHHGSYINHGNILRCLIWLSQLVGLPGIICLFYAVWKRFFCS